MAGVILDRASDRLLLERNGSARSAGLAYEFVYPTAAEPVRRMPEAHNSGVFSPIRSFDFNVGVFVLIDGDRGGVLVARELTVEEIQHVGKHRAHTNGVVLQVDQVRPATAQGVDLTDMFRVAWDELIQQVR